MGLVRGSAASGWHAPGPENGRGTRTRIGDLRDGLRGSFGITLSQCWLVQGCRVPLSDNRVRGAIPNLGEMFGSSVVARCWCALTVRTHPLFQGIEPLPGHQTAGRWPEQSWAAPLGRRAGTIPGPCREDSVRTFRIDRI